MIPAPHSRPARSPRPPAAGAAALPLRLAAALAALLAAIVVPFVLWGAPLEAWTRSLLLEGRVAGPPAALLCVALLGSDLLLPVPSSLVSLAAGLAFGFLPGAALSWAGLTLGAAAGFALGRAGRTAVLGRRDAERIARLEERFGDAAVPLLRPVPVLAEASAVLAGASGMSWRRFLLLAGAANVVVSAFHAGAGALALRLPGAAAPLAVAASLALVAAAAGAARALGRRS